VLINTDSLANPDGLARLRWIFEGEPGFHEVTPDGSASTG
jgi:hypothetical protein